MRNELLKYAVILLVAVGGLQTVRAQRVRADAESANVLSVKKATDLPEGDLADRIETDGAGNRL